MSPGGNTLPSGTKSSKPAECQVLEVRSKNFARGSPGVIVAPLPFPPLDPSTHKSWLSENQHHILDADSEYIQPCKVLPPNWHCHWAFKTPFHPPSSQIFKMVENMVRPVNSTGLGPVPHFISCEVSPLTRSNAVQNTVMVDDAFCKPTDGIFGRSIARRKVNPCPE